MQIKAELKRLWVLACEYDGIDQDESFVCFTDDNPHLIRYNKLMSMYLAGKKQRSITDKAKNVFPGIALH